MDTALPAEIETMARPGANDSQWERRRLDIWSLPDHRDVKHAMLRKRFTVPSDWANGKIRLWIVSWVGSTFVDRGRVFLDGKVVRDWQEGGLTGMDCGLRPGSSHVLAVEVTGKGFLQGVRGSAWLSYLPAPAQSQDLAGEWIPTRDGLHDDVPVQFPGKWNTLLASKTVPIPASLKAMRVELSVDCEGWIVGAIVNGHYTRRHHHMIGSHFDLDITPWIHFGRDNQIELVHWSGPGPAEIKAVEIHYTPSTSHQSMVSQSPPSLSTAMVWDPGSRGTE
jgi:hypothetical protein